MRLLSQDLSIVSVNLRKRLGDSTCRSNFEAWLADHRPEVLLAQEPVGQAKRLAGPTMYTLKGYQLLERTALVASWCRDDLQAAEIKTHTNRWQEITVHSLSIHNVYLPSESGRERIEMLGEMASYLRGSTFETLIAGDFNLAPKPEDRRFDGQPTIKLKSDRDREAKALDSLLSATSLYDATCDLQEFSWVQLRDKNSRKFSEWRCDLALLSNSLRAGAKVKYDHYLRDIQFPTLVRTTVASPITAPSS